ncbi:XRE family transcriptional regulator [Ktedonosporobacter rubrisoli]|uniref:XRE family transcriptional regulator n=1 Tax=Ktedonosporobacter rubrisoli TaxID=2509675 RepID=A0A4P6JNW5_KTERU|nr:helix-turn-helix transcriptional regulator [Ktedonosporobacter rubrisoli]QBD76426.1 XRE family transcriptional regulator [Ktedonosporobacter rubrisoli]
MLRIKVKEIARQKKMSQRKLFLRSRVDLRTLQRIYHDEYANITLDTLGRIAYGLDVNASELIEGRSDTPEHLRDLITPSEELADKEL